MPGDSQPHACPLLGIGDAVVRQGRGEEGVQILLGKVLAAVGDREDGPVPALGQGKEDRTLGSGLGRVGQQGENQLGQQIRVAGNQQGTAVAAEGEGHPGALQQGGGLIAETAAQPHQVHGDRLEKGLGRAQRTQIV